MFRKIAALVAGISLLANSLGCAVHDFKNRPPALLDTLPNTPSSATVSAADAEQPAAEEGEPSEQFGDVRPVNFTQLESEAADETGITLAVDVEFQDEALEVVMVTLLFDAGKFKIIGSPDLPVTAAIRALSMDDAMQQLQDQSDVLIVKRGDRYIVYSEGAEAEVADQMISYIYKCRRAKATDIVGIIDGQAPEGFPTAGELSTGQPIAPVQEVAVGSKIMASDGLTKPLGDVEFQVVHHMNGIILRGKLADIRAAVDFLKTIDRPIPIVLIELLIVQYLHEDAFRWGYNLFDGQVARADAPISGGEVLAEGLKNSTAHGWTLDPVANNTFGPTASGWNFERIAMNAATGALPFQFSAIGSLTSNFKNNVTLLCSEDLARVVTNPHVGVINGHRGTIMLNEKINFFTNIVQPITGTVEQKQTEINNITGLTVTPTIVGPDRIHMAINATVSAFIGVETAQLLPNQRINEIATSVVLGDNETLIIGGLVKEEIVEDRNKVPGFAGIPLLGHLFRAKETDRRFTETVIYVTPHLAQPQGYEDAYLKQIFRQVDRLSKRTEEIRCRHRDDRGMSHRNYRWKEKLDHQTTKELCKEEIQHHLEPLRRHARHHQGYPYYELIETSDRTATSGEGAPGGDVAPDDDGGFPGSAPSESTPRAVPPEAGEFPGFGLTPPANGPSAVPQGAIGGLSDLETTRE